MFIIYERGEFYMIKINEQMREYMVKYDWRHIVLSVEKFTS